MIYSTDVNWIMDLWVKVSQIYCMDIYDVVMLANEILSIVHMQTVIDNEWWWYNVHIDP